MINRVRNLNETFQKQLKEERRNMIELSFTIDSEDIAETNQFLETVLSHTKTKNSYNEVLGVIRFSINGGDNMSFCGDSYKDELVPFAVDLSEIVQTIKVGEEKTQYQMSDCGKLYYKLVDAQNILVTLQRPRHIEALCDFTELKSKTELFCEALYNEIVRLFPTYFEVKDMLSGGFRNEWGETYSEAVRRLLLRS
jgi:hypothetical protein